MQQSHPRTNCKMVSKGACLVVFCCFLMHMTIVGSDISFYHAVEKDGIFGYLISQSLAYLLYPLLGWLADVYFTRYKFVLYSFITMIMATFLMIITSGLLLYFTGDRELYILGGLSVTVSLIGMGLFKSTSIQFGMDQMLEASSAELSTFIHWYFWSSAVGRLLAVCCATIILVCYSQCVIELNVDNATDLYNDLHPYYFTITITFFIIMAGVQLVCACVGLFLLIGSKKYLNVDRTGEHPIKLIYGVLRYAFHGYQLPSH